MLKPLEPTLVVNICGDRRKFSIASDPEVMPRVYDLAPGDSVEVPGAYGMRRQTAPGRDLLPSVIENQTNGQVVPAADPRAKAILDAKAREIEAARAASAPAAQGKQAR